MGRFFRRFFRYAFHLAAGCSALALLACVILWPLSYGRAMTLGYVTSGGSTYALGGGGGRLFVHHRVLRGAPSGFSCQFAPLDPSYTAWSYTDWKHEEVSMRLGTRDRALGCLLFRIADLSYLGLPFLYPTLLSALLLTFWLRWFRRKRQARRARRGFPVESAE